MNQPPGLQFFDGRSQRRLLFVQHPGHELNGWLCHQSPEGQWLKLRKADGRDMLAIQQATRDQTMDEDNEITRTEDEIVARMRSLGADKTLDSFGIERSRLLDALPWEQAQQFMRSDQTEHTAERWEVRRTRTHKSAIAQIREYLGFAWNKANQGQGISARRAMSHFKGLLWLLGPEHDGLREWIGNPEHHEFFGKPGLVKVSEVVGFDWRVKLDENGNPKPRRDNDEWIDPDPDEGDVGAEPLTADEALGLA